MQTQKGEEVALLIGGAIMGEQELAFVFEVVLQVGVALKAAEPLALTV